MRASRLGGRRRPRHGPLAARWRSPASSWLVEVDAEDVDGELRADRETAHAQIADPLAAGGGAHPHVRVPELAGEVLSEPRQVRGEGRGQGGEHPAMMLRAMSGGTFRSGRAASNASTAPGPARTGRRGSR